MKSDLEIARETKLRPIAEIAAKLDIPADALEPYGRHKAKIGIDFIKSLESRPDGALVLVTGISPTPAGEGKTTTTVGLGDALNRIGSRAVICLREPIARAELRHEGRRGRRRLLAGGADGPDQPALHRRLPRHHLGQQPAGRDDRQPHLLGQFARHRRAARVVAALPRHERPRAALASSAAWAAWPTASRARTASTSPSPPR